MVEHMNPNEDQFAALAARIREVGSRPVKPERDPKKGTHRTPSIGRVHAALEGGHINLEEAQDLNPKYDPSKKLHNYTMMKKSEYADRDPNYNKKYYK
jgi:hypothetical protein